MDSDDRKWDHIESQIARRNKDVSHAVTRVSSSHEANLDIAGGTRDAGIVQRYQMNNIARKANVEAWKEAYAEKLKVWVTKIQTEGDIARQEILLQGQKELERLNSEHLNQLKELDVVNFEKKAEMLRDLGSRLANHLDECSQQSMPPTIRDRTIDGVMKLYEQLFEKILQEKIEGKGGKGK